LKARDRQASPCQNPRIFAEQRPDAGAYPTMGIGEREAPPAMPKESEGQKETIHRVMHEYKHGELRSGGSGKKVKNPRQAVAIALSEAGASNQESREKNAERLHETKEKERKGETAQAQAKDEDARPKRGD
jgi:hypothetical protein